MKAILGKLQGKFAARAIVGMCMAFGVTVAFSPDNTAYAQTGVDRTSAGSRGDEFVASPIQEDPRAIEEYWTYERMKAAERAEGTAVPTPEKPILPGADQSGYVPMPTPYTSYAASRKNGMLFFRVPGGRDEHCSASVITSSSQSLVLTAAHCAHKSDGGWREMMVFVPAYNGSASGGERAPYGKWPVKQAFIPHLNADSTRGDDIAVLSVYVRTTPVGLSRTIEEVVGGGFEPLMTEDGSFESVQLVGYPGNWVPGDGPYDGEQRRCESPAIPYEQSNQLTLTHCASQSGNSGGPLLLERPPFETQVVGVVHFTFEYSRLLPQTFLPIYRAANDAASR